MCTPTFNATIRLRNEMAKKVILDNTQKNKTYVCGVDVAYRNNIAYCSAVLMNKDGMEVKHSMNLTLKVKHHYAPTFFMLTESEPIINILKSLKNRIDILLIDGHGVLHPRRCGLASYVGVIIDRPTIGVAKSLLCGIVRENDFIYVDGVTSGFRLTKEKKKLVYVSVGHKVNLIDAIEIVRQLVKPKEQIPEPLRLAHINSKNLATTSIS
ncbi:MAG TPA: endonuclease V [Candidatus Bathyarchaeia archaeon]|nr:endonuclease V [Candidatus Bathyarchaeia archaeon]